MTSNQKAVLYLLPSPLGPEGMYALPAYLLEKILPLRHFIVENEKTARRYLRKLGFEGDFNEVELYLLNKHTDPLEMMQFLDPMKKGESMALLSEAGCPGVADPGADMVALAHRNNFIVEPMVGPSSLILALMGSGMNGQGFHFHGYLPIDAKARISALKTLENESRKSGHSQIFIEAPYRNEPLWKAMMENLQAQSRVCLAMNLNQSNEFIRTMEVAAWSGKKIKMHKMPAVFIIQA